MIKDIKKQPPVLSSVFFPPYFIPNLFKFPICTCLRTPKDSLPCSLAPVAFPTQPGSGFHNIMITVCEKCLLGTGKRKLRWKNDVPTQLGEDSVGFPRSFTLCLFFCQAKEREGGMWAPLPAKHRRHFPLSLVFLRVVQAAASSQIAGNK